MSCNLFWCPVILCHVTTCPVRSLYVVPVVVSLATGTRRKLRIVLESPSCCIQVRSFHLVLFVIQEILENSSCVFPEIQKFVAQTAAQMWFKTASPNIHVSEILLCGLALCLRGIFAFSGKASSRSAARWLFTLAESSKTFRSSYDKD